MIIASPGLISDLRRGRRGRSHLEQPDGLAVEQDDHRVDAEGRPEGDVEHVEERNDQHEDAGPFLVLEEPPPAEDLRQSDEAEERAGDDADQAQDARLDIQAGDLGDAEEDEKGEERQAEGERSQNDPENADDLDVIFHVQPPISFIIRESGGGGYPVAI
ncbi:MAG: hypothetical protein MZV63_13475 [Marinilabiliales bacterium]|nr:hypothetical protein [Marinilabiliales bacterium]